MPTFKTNIAMDVRVYGAVTVEAETEEAARALLTAKYVAENFEPHGSGSDDYDFDHPSDIWAEGLHIEDEDCEDFSDFGVPDGPWITKS